MKMKPKGRKIYRKKTKFDKMQDFKSNTSAIVGTIIALVVFVFVGYSIGGPVIQFLQESHILAVPNEVGETVPATQPTEVVTETVTETQAPTEPPVTMPDIRGYALPSSALLTQSALEAALQAVPEGITHVLVPLKTQGGGLYYASALPDAAKCGAVQAAIPLPVIHDTVEKAGFFPVAVMNTLEDTIYPQAYSDAGYRYATGEIWLDAAPEKGGVPHMSPFSDMAKDYLSNLAAEIRLAGFRTIICEGLDFPDFSEEQLAALDAHVSDAQRYTALTALVEKMQEAAPHTEFYVQLDGNAVMHGHTDGVTASEAMEIAGVIFTVNTASQSGVDMLRGMPVKHAAVFAWNDLPVPEGEKSYIRMESVQTPVQPTGEESDTNPIEE